MELKIKTAQPRVSFGNAKNVRLAVKEAFRKCLVSDVFDEGDMAAKIAEAKGGIETAMKLAVMDDSFERTLPRIFDRWKKSMHFELSEANKGRGVLERFMCALSDAIDYYGKKPKNPNMPKILTDLEERLVEKIRTAQ